MKSCSKCGVKKPLSDYFKRSFGSADGRMSSCKKCKTVAIYSWREKNHESHLKYHRERYRAQRGMGRWGRLASSQPEYRAIVRRKNRYGITENQYADMMKMQDGKCAICKSIFTCSKYPQVDHCHKNGGVRGLLCGPCNTSLGGFKDNIEILGMAIEYIIRSNNMMKARGGK